METKIDGYCCPRYECHVPCPPTNGNNRLNVTTPLPLLRQSRSTKGCSVDDNVYQINEVVKQYTNPCKRCKCMGNGLMDCLPIDCNARNYFFKMRNQLLR